MQWRERLGLFVVVLSLAGMCAAPGNAQKPVTGGARTGAAGAPALSGEVPSSGTLTVYVREPSGSIIRQLAVVTVTLMTQQYFRQLTTQGGSATFEGVVSGRYTVQAVASGYENTSQEVELTGMNTMVSIDLIMQPLRDASGAVIPGPPILAPKAQKQLGQALQALRENKQKDALAHLNNALKAAPNHPEVHYLFGVYYAREGDWTQAKASWKKAIEVYPEHAGANLSLGEALYRDANYAGAATCLAKAVQLDPASWRGQLLYANVLLRQKSLKEAAEHARRAIEIGHTQAASARFVLAEVYFEQGDKDAAGTQLRTYLQERPGDATAQKALDQLHGANGTNGMGMVAAIPVMPVSEAVPVVTKWLPPDIDEITPPVETGVACTLPDVLDQASGRVSEFLKDVDRFTATESLHHETLNAWGIVSATENRKFNYLVSYRELRPHYFAVEEYRDGSLDLSKFPEGIATVGLPSLMLVFEKVQRQNYDMKCEGLTRWHGGLAWQIHFAQRADKPRQLRAYRLGPRSYPIAIKGRAWIAADTYQILRMETDLISAPKEIHLTAEHINLEYGAVYFNGQKEPLWVPQNAEIYIDWQGHRIHRRHKFDDFLLFGVDEKMKIAPPKEDPAQMGSGENGASKPPA